MRAGTDHDTDEGCRDPLVTRRAALARTLGGTLALAGAVTACRDGDTTSTEVRSDPAPEPVSNGSTPEAPSEAGVDVGTPVTASSTTTAAGRPVPERDPDVHRLRRLTFGPTAPDLEHIRAIGANAWLDEQLAPGGIDTSDVDDVVLTAFPQLDSPAADMLAEYRANPEDSELVAVLAGAMLVRNTRSPAQLQERLVEFWGDHFNVPQVGPPSTIARIVMDREVFREHALGAFDDLLVSTARSPAMLTYLDNFRSRAGNINENYARELLELHTVGVDGGYDEADIRAVARLMTGWTIDRDLEFRFVARVHDPGAVSILGWDRPATGDPETHGEEFLRHLARLPATAEHVCRKLAVRFVADDPDEALVRAMTVAWHEHDTAIAPVVRAMVGHPAFDEAPPKFNRPWDYFVQTLRSLDADLDIEAPYDRLRADGAVRDLGQVPFRWATPDGYPDVEAAWLNAGGLLARWNLAAALTLGDETFDAGWDTRVTGLRGLPAGEVYDRLATELRHEPPTDEQVDGFGDLTSWELDQVPDDEDLDQLAPLVGFVLLAGPEAHYR